MQKSVDAVTHMPPNSDCVVIFPDSTEGITIKQNATVPFDEEVIDFLNQLSHLLLQDGECRAFPDVVTFAFFCRKANLFRLRNAHMPSGIRLGRGIVFHIAPGNVPVNFAYSLVVGLLSGNNNIVKLSSKPFPQVDIIIRGLKKLKDHPVAQRIVLVKYAHDSKASEEFSSIADARIIWGGDETIKNIRNLPVQPRAVDICFADRYSIGVIEAASILTSSNDALDELAERFYNDTYLFDQNACSSPHLIIWKGSQPEIDYAKDIFWERVHGYVELKYVIQPIMAVDKLTNFYRQSIFLEAKAEKSYDNLIVRAKIDKLLPEIERLRCAGGYFLEYDTQELTSIQNIIGRKYQTICYYGNLKEELKQLIELGKPTGVDRIVPIGETSSFSLIWDGYDLMNVLAREITIS